MAMAPTDQDFVKGVGAVMAEQQAAPAPSQGGMDDYVKGVGALLPEDQRGPSAPHPLAMPAASPRKLTAVTPSWGTDHAGSAPAWFVDQKNPNPMHDLTPEDPFMARSGKERMAADEQTAAQ